MTGRVRQLALATVLALPAACRNEDEPPSDRTSAGPAPPSSGPPTLREKTITALESLGDEGTVLLVVRPSLWPRARATIGPMVRGFAPDASADIAAALGAHGLPALMLRLLGVDHEWNSMAGWDPERPITASIMETSLHGPVGGLTPTLDFAALPKVRHQVLIPATGTDTLVASLHAQLASMGQSWPQLVEDQEGAKAALVGDVAVALVPDNEHVRVIVIHPVSGDDEIVAAKAALAVTPAALRITRPASLLLRPDTVIAALIRPWRLRPFAILRGAQGAAAALRTASAQRSAVLRARATQLVLSSELLMSDVGADFDETVIAAHADAGVLGLHMASQLTRRGAAIMDASARGAGGRLPGSTRGAWVRASFSANLRGMLDATAAPPGLADPATGPTTIAESGAYAAAYVALRFPFGLLKLGHAAATDRRLPIPLDPLPTAGQLAWVGLDTRGLPKGSIAFQWPANASTAAITGLVSLAKTDPTWSELSVTTRQHDGNPVTVVNFGANTDAMQPATPADPRDVIGQVRGSFAPIAAALTVADAHIGRALAPLGMMEVRWSRDGDVLNTAAVLSVAGTSARAQPLPVAPHTTPQNSSGLPPRIDARARKCLDGAGTAIATGLRALTVVDAASLGAVAAATLSRAGPHLACAARFAATRDAAAALRRMYTMAAADVILSGGGAASAVMVLGAECRASGDPVVCARAKRIERLPTPTPADVARPARCAATPGPPEIGARLEIDARGIGVVDELVTAAALASLVGDRATSSSVQLTIDKDTTMATIRPVLEALRSAEIDRVVFTVIGGGETWPIPARIVDAWGPKPPSTAGPWVRWTLAGDTITTHEVATALATMPSAAELSATLSADAEVVIAAADDVQWQDVAVAVAAGCPRANLSLMVP